VFIEAEGQGVASQFTLDASANPGIGVMFKVFDNF
jgi:hypothetical protein